MTEREPEKRDVCPFSKHKLAVMGGSEDLEAVQRKLIW
jgi:hypothetical protein